MVTGFEGVEFETKGITRMANAVVKSGKLTRQEVLELIQSDESLNWYFPEQDFRWLQE